MLLQFRHLLTSARCLNRSRIVSLPNLWAKRFEPIYLTWFWFSAQSRLCCKNSPHHLFQGSINWRACIWGIWEPKKHFFVRQYPKYYQLNLIVSIKPRKLVILSTYLMHFRCATCFLLKILGLKRALWPLRHRLTAKFWRRACRIPPALRIQDNEAISKALYGFIIAARAYRGRGPRIPDSVKRLHFL